MIKCQLTNYCMGVFLIVVVTVKAVAQPGNMLVPFKAAVVKMDITPNEPKQLLGYQARKSTGIRDRIYHRILAMDDGRRQFFLISSDLCIISPVEYDQVAGRLKKELGIDPVNVWWTTTHTHSAPEVGHPDITNVFMPERYEHPVDTVYTDFVVHQLLEGIRQVQRNLTPARLGIGWGHSNANINRRARLMNGTSTLGVDPDGPVDRRIGLIKLEKTDGTLLGTVANYAMHGTVLGNKNMHISGDGPGVVAEYVEKQSGAPMLFINGAAGNIAPIYSTGSGDALEQFNLMLGDKILEAAKKIATGTEVNLYAGEAILETPRRLDLSWPQRLAKFNRTTKAGEHFVRMPIRFFKINDELAVWGAPVELFCEISNEIRERSPFPNTFYFGYCNGWFGYLLPENEWKWGGYEPSVSSVTSQAADDLIKLVMNYLEGDFRAPVKLPKPGKEIR